MKRNILFAAISSLGALSLASAPVAFAAAVCPNGSDFSALCTLNPGNDTFIFQNVFTILLVAAVGLSVGFLLFGGIKWITSGGDKGKVDAARGTITAAIVGLIIAFLAFFIVGLVSFVFGVKSGTAFSLPTLNAKPAP